MLEWGSIGESLLHHSNYPLLQRDLKLGTDFAFKPPITEFWAEDRRVMEGRRTIPNQVWMVPQRRSVPEWYVSTKTPLMGPGGEVTWLALSAVEHWALGHLGNRS